jgi:hypothetical protein
MINGIVFQIHGDLNNNEEKVKVKAKQIRDLYGKFSSVFKKTLKKAINNENFNLYNIINQWIIKKELTQQQEGETSIQLYSVNNLDSTENIFPKITY